MIPSRAPYQTAQVGILAPPPWGFKQVSFPICASVYSSVARVKGRESTPHDIAISVGQKHSISGNFIWFILIVHMQEWW